MSGSQPWSGVRIAHRSTVVRSTRSPIVLAVLTRRIRHLLGWSHCWRL